MLRPFYKEGIVLKRFLTIVLPIVMLLTLISITAAQEAIPARLDGRDRQVSDAATAMTMVSEPVIITTGPSSQTIIINRTDSGWYDIRGLHQPFNDNYIVGNCCGNIQYRNFFVFTLPTISGHITAATLQAVNPIGIGTPHTYTLYDVATPITSLTAGGEGRVDVFRDLGSGRSYGSGLISDPSASPIRINLNATGIAAIQAMVGRAIAIGGDYASGSEGFLFAASHDLNLTNVQLILEVRREPEVPVDIKPGSCPNPLNTLSRGVLPIAILGTKDFDIRTIDPTSIKLEGAAPLRWNREDVGTPYTPFTGKDSADDCTRAGSDGRLDLTLKFDTQDLVRALGTVIDGQAVVLELTGRLQDGTLIGGEDVIVIHQKKDR